MNFQFGKSYSEANKYLQQQKQQITVAYFLLQNALKIGVFSFSRFNKINFSLSRSLFD
jgi:hypothetical protein